MDIAITLSKQEVETVMHHVGLTSADPWKLVTASVANEVRGFATDTIRMIARDQKERIEKRLEKALG